MFKNKRIKDLETKVGALETEVSMLISELNKSRARNNENLNKVLDNMYLITEWMRKHDGINKEVH